MSPTTPSSELERLLAGARALEGGVALAAVALLGVTASLATARPAAGIAAAVVAAAVALSRGTRRASARRFERRHPELDGSVVAFAEGGGGRLREALAAWILDRRPSPVPRRAIAVLLVSGFLAAATAFSRRSGDAAPSVPEADMAAASASVPATPLRLSVEVTPPAYTGRPATRVDEPRAPVEALAGSTATLLLEGTLGTVDVSVEGSAPTTLRLAGGRARESFLLRHSTAVRVGSDRVLVFDVRADAPPEVELTLPREDRVVESAPGAFEVRAAARDDVGLTSLSLHYTLAHGRGEGMTFKSHRVDQPSARGLAADASMRVDPAALGLGAGDTLVVWAEATDGNAVDGPSRTASPVRLLRWEEPLARIEMKSSAPALRPLNGPLSQREILARTIRLVAARLPAGTRRDRCTELADEQRKLRDAFGFFLHAEEGDAVELDFEEKEVAETGSRHARRLVAEAVSAMWSSAAELTVDRPEAAIPWQRIALKKLDEAFGNERYALRALAPPRAPVDETRRLQGDAKGLAPRTKPETREDDDPGVARLAALARRLLLASEGLSTEAPRVLADALWFAPEAGGLARSALVAPLYAAKTAEETRVAERRAAESLLRVVASNPIARPAVSSSERRVFERLDKAR